MKILVLNGPNLNMLGIREPAIYGHKTYNDLVENLKKWSDDLNIETEIYQSNHEGCLVDKIQESYGVHDGIIINPAAYTHTSVAVLDALKAVGIPAVEVHLSEPSEREAFRHISYAGIACIARFTGRGFDSYRLALEFFAETLKQG